MSGDKDLAVGVAGIPMMGAIYKKPAHLVVLELPETKNKVTTRFFISLDKPSYDGGFISVKGFFNDSSESDISKSYADLVNNTSKDLIEEYMFPIHRVLRIKNLVFKAK
jgi:hypothetical protein